MHLYDSHALDFLAAAVVVAVVVGDIAAVAHTTEAMPTLGAALCPYLTKSPLPAPQQASAYTSGLNGWGVHQTDPLDIQPGPYRAAESAAAAAAVHAAAADRLCQRHHLELGMQDGHCSALPAVDVAVAAAAAPSYYHEILLLAQPSQMAVVLN